MSELNFNKNFKIVNHRTRWKRIIKKHGFKKVYENPVKFISKSKPFTKKYLTQLRYTLKKDIKMSRNLIQQKFKTDNDNIELLKQWGRTLNMKNGSPVFLLGFTSAGNYEIFSTQEIANLKEILIKVIELINESKKLS